MYASNSDSDGFFCSFEQCDALNYQRLIYVHVCSAWLIVDSRAKVEFTWSSGLSSVPFVRIGGADGGIPLITNH